MIRLHGIERAYRVGDETVHALRPLDLDIPSGAYLSIMGSSGSGKSTLLHLLGLLDRPDRGEYRLDGVDTGGLGEEERARLRRERIGFVFQSFHLIPRLTAAENVELPLILEGLPPAERRQRVKEVLAAFGLGERANHRPDQLSGGQRQRVAIARATILRPALLLADEPTGNLDKQSGQEVVEVLERLHQEGITLLVVTHDPLLGERAPQRLRMADGSVVERVGLG